MCSQSVHPRYKHGKVVIVNLTVEPDEYVYSYVCAK